MKRTKLKCFNDDLTGYTGHWGNFRCYVIDKCHKSGRIAKLDDFRIALKPYNARLGVRWGSISFDSESDKTMFLLKWS